MKLTLLRHGETEENRLHIVQGQRAGQLSERGKQEVLEVAKKLKDVKFDAIYSSDLLRCKDTVIPIHNYHKDVPLRYSKAVREISFGRLEGMPSPFFKFTIRIGAALNLKAPGGENWGDLKRRVIPFLNQVYSEYPNGNILVVTHGGPIRLITALLDKNPHTRPHSLIIPNCSIWEHSMNRLINL
jgi:broad specificity phosphatase PhoE